MKTCTKCKVEKKEAMFSKRSSSKDGLQQHCKACKLEYQRNNPKRNAVSAKYRNANKEICLVRTRLSQDKKREYYHAKTMERDDKSRRLLKDYQAAATQAARMKLLNERLAYDQQQRLQVGQLAPKGTKDGI